MKITLKPYQTEKQLVRIHPIFQILFVYTIALFFEFVFCFSFLFAVKLSIFPFIGVKIESFYCFFRGNWPHVKITLKLHAIEKHVIDFIAKWGVAFG